MKISLPCCPSSPWHALQPSNSIPPISPPRRHSSSSLSDITYTRTAFFLGYYSNLLGRRSGWAVPKVNGSQPWSLWRLNVYILSNKERGNVVVTAAGSTWLYSSQIWCGLKQKRNLLRVKARNPSSSTKQQNLHPPTSHERDTKAPWRYVFEW